MMSDKALKLQKSEISDSVAQRQSNTDSNFLQADDKTDNADIEVNDLPLDNS